MVLVGRSVSGSVSPSVSGWVGRVGGLDSPVPSRPVGGAFGVLGVLGVLVWELFAKALVEALWCPFLAGLWELLVPALAAPPPA